MTRLAQTETNGSPTPMRTGRLWVALILLVALIGIDQATKYWAEEELAGNMPRVYLGGLFTLEYAENSGAFLSLGSGWSGPTRFWVLTVISGGMLAVVAYLLIRRSDMYTLSFVALSLILAGGLGNLVDRLRQDFVVDFMLLGVGSLHTGVFNVADVAITTGVGLLLLPHRQKNGEAPESPAVTDQKG